MMQFLKHMEESLVYTCIYRIEHTHIYIYCAVLKQIISHVKVEKLVIIMKEELQAIGFPYGHIYTCEFVAAI